MPIIEFDHIRKQYHVYVAKTIEWGIGKHSNSYNHAAPFVGIAENGGLDAAHYFVFREQEMDKALEKMAELWAEWKKSNFEGVVHA